MLETLHDAERLKKCKALCTEQPTASPSTDSRSILRITLPPLITSNPDALGAAAEAVKRQIQKASPAGTLVVVTTVAETTGIVTANANLNEVGRSELLGGLNVVACHSRKKCTVAWSDGGGRRRRLKLSVSTEMRYDVRYVVNVNGSDTSLITVSRDDLNDALGSAGSDVNVESVSAPTDITLSIEVATTSKTISFVDTVDVIDTVVVAANEVIGKQNAVRVANGGTAQPTITADDVVVTISHSADDDDDDGSADGHAAAYIGGVVGGAAAVAIAAAIFTQSECYKYLNADAAPVRAPNDV